jgi:glucokinase
LINDFEANAYAMPLLKPQDYTTIISGSSSTGLKSFLVTGPGTGLGLCYGEILQNKLYVKPTEAGHSLMTATTPWQLELKKYLLAQQIQPEWEALLSGPGLVKLFQFFSPSDRQSADSNLDAAAISSLAKQDKHSTAFHTLSCFLELLGLFVHNASLMFLPRSAIFLAGGILPKIIPIVGTDPFIKGYQQQSLLDEQAERPAVHLVTNDYPGLAGALAYWHQQVQIK